MDGSGGDRVLRVRLAAEIIDSHALARNATIHVCASNIGNDSAIGLLPQAPKAVVPMDRWRPLAEQIALADFVARRTEARPVERGSRLVQPEALDGKGETTLDQRGELAGSAHSRPEG